jgi:hypothetical protein
MKCCEYAPRFIMFYSTGPWSRQYDAQNNEDKGVINFWFHANRSKISCPNILANIPSANLALVPSMEQHASNNSIYNRGRL